MTIDRIPTSLQTPIIGHLNPLKPIVKLSQMINWDLLENKLKHLFSHKERDGYEIEISDLFGTFNQKVGSGISNAGRPRKSFRLMLSLLFLKYINDLSDEEVVEEWSDNISWQYCSGLEYIVNDKPCNASQLTRFRQILGEAGSEEILKSTIDLAVNEGMIDPKEFEEVIFDTTVQEKNIRYPTDINLVYQSHKDLVKACKKNSIPVPEGVYYIDIKDIYLECVKAVGSKKRKKDFQQLFDVLKTKIIYFSMEVKKLFHTHIFKTEETKDNFKNKLDMVWKICKQTRHSKKKTYSTHESHVDCIAKGKTGIKYQFGCKVSICITKKRTLIIGARAFFGNPHDGDTIEEQLSQTNVLLEDIDYQPKIIYTDLGYQGRDHLFPGIKIVHKRKELTDAERVSLKRRSSIEPVIGHLKSDCGLDVCYLKGKEGDIVQPILSSIGYNLRWFIRVLSPKKKNARKLQPS